MHVIPSGSLEVASLITLNLPLLKNISGVGRTDRRSGRNVDNNKNCVGQKQRCWGSCILGTVFWAVPMQVAI